MLYIRYDHLTEHLHKITVNNNMSCHRPSFTPTLWLSPLNHDSKVLYSDILYSQWFVEVYIVILFSGLWKCIGHIRLSDIL